MAATSCPCQSVITLGNYGDKEHGRGQIYAHAWATSLRLPGGCNSITCNSEVCLSNGCCQCTDATLTGGKQYLGAVALDIPADWSFQNTLTWTIQGCTCSENNGAQFRFSWQIGANYYEVTDKDVSYYSPSSVDGWPTSDEAKEDFKNNGGGFGGGGGANYGGSWSCTNQYTGFC